MFHVNPRAVSECPRVINRSDGHDPVTSLGGSRSIGKFGTAARVIVGVAFLYLGVVGLPPIHLLPWWQVLIGLLGAPAMLTLIQLARLAFTRDRLDQTGIVALVINFVVFVALLIFEPTRGATLVFSALPCCLLRPVAPAAARSWRFRTGFFAATTRLGAHFSGQLML